MTEVDDVIRRVNGGETMSAAEARQVAALLNHHAWSGRPGLPEARVRVAVLLEKLGE
ncbi:hypothetical protein ACI782_17955 [Geodermatophilus sp. SYSU D00703]